MVFLTKLHWNTCKPRCGVKDILHDLDDSPRKWAKTHLTWNFHLASESVLLVTEVAFEMWAANSSLTFERNSTNSDIVISFRKGFHTFVDPRHQGSRICPSLLDGPGNVLAHAFLPSSEVSEVHAEKWHIELTVNPDDTIHLLHTLTHEIGHALGLHHSPLKDAIMYAFVPSKIFPMRLSEADVLAIQNLYGLRNKSEIAGPITTTVATTTIATRDTGNSADLCALRRVDAVLILENRIYVTYRHYLWSVDLNGKSYGRSLLLTDYLRFLPDNFTRLAGAYRRPSGQLVLFVDNTVYMIEYPSFELVPGWPRKLKDMNLPPNAKINAVINTNAGRTFAIYNDEIVAEIDDCSMIAVRHNSLHAIFPGIPPAVTFAVRYIDGNLYFFVKRQFFKYNEFTRSVTMAAPLDIGNMTVRFGKINNLTILRLETSVACLAMSRETVKNMFELEHCISRLVISLTKILGKINAKLARFKDIALTAKDKENISKVIRDSDAYDRNDIIDCELVALYFGM
ncbi:matrix metalloproteinase-2-like [Pogonomyrmex barbatus]|uniref:Matrix metalloproteinase-2-like n=1 Tax=Pogonomyrmex barbatus TaxID=144034 RepID=A0A6I9VZJ1_9HYME|nr:matrix metalloproteinase-2-like [Pogonomyrmex barbatus]